MGSGGSGIAVGLDEEKAGRIVGLLDKIESCNARLAQACLRVCKRGGFEGIDVFRQNVNVNVDDKHGSRVRAKAVSKSLLVIFLFPLSLNLPLALRQPLTKEKEKDKEERLAGRL